MNWCSKKTEPSDVRRWLDDDRSDVCEHVENGTAKAVAVLCEDDSFGPVGRYVVCAECETRADAQEQEQQHPCIDCKGFKPLSQGDMWRGWDHYPPQGDEELFICQPCWQMDKHKKRMDEDKRDRQRNCGED